MTGNAAWLHIITHCAHQHAWLSINLTSCGLPVLQAHSASLLLLLCLQTASLSSFVRQHVVLRTDTLQMLAVRHGIDVPGLKRVNNLMTDHSLHSRTHLFIPGGCNVFGHNFVEGAGVLC
jgi:hypothetical protein